MSEYKFEDNDIPYDVLAEFGLTKEMIEDLPTPIMNRLCEGQRTPVLPIKFKTDSEEIRSRARIALVRSEQFTTEVVFFPQLQKSDLSMFDEDKQARLLAGKAVLDSMTTEDGNKVNAFHQIDANTGQVLSVPTPVIGHNLQIICDEFQLHNAEAKCLQNGEVLTLMVGDEDVTCGIDLNSPTGVRVCKGDERQWREQTKQELAKYNFGLFGCWTCDEQGNLDYVKEENYIEEMWNELKKTGAKRAAANAHKY
jgi:hypothetical protein